MRGTFLAGFVATVQIGGQPLQEHETEPPGADARKTAAATTIRPFVFAEHKNTDALAKPEMLKAFGEIGEIKVKIMRCTTTRSQKLDSKSTFVSAAEGGVPEKALKGRAVTTHTKLGAAKPSSTRPVHCEHPWGKGPIGVYIFKYRTHKGLQQEGVIERSPSPVPLEERDAETLTQAELREVVRRLQADKESAARIKKEGQRPKKRTRSETLAVSTPGLNDDDITVASESSDRKKAKIAESEVIDICDSNDEED
ncbi:hypothetical protein LTR95_010239 [Oleoguttula sp. CCFEE 5521]